MQRAVLRSAKINYCHRPGAINPYNRFVRSYQRTCLSGISLVEGAVGAGG